MLKVEVSTFNELLYSPSTVCSTALLQDKFNRSLQFSYHNYV